MCPAGGGSFTDLAGRVEAACDELVAKGERVTFAAVAGGAGLAKATLYRRPELRAIVEQRRRADHEAHSLTGIVTELGLLRQGLVHPRGSYADMI